MIEILKSLNGKRFDLFLKNDKFIEVQPNFEVVTTDKMCVIKGLTHKYYINIDSISHISEFI